VIRSKHEATVLDFMGILHREIAAFASAAKIDRRDLPNALRFHDQLQEAERS
jgi:hypothetical protein